MTALDKSVVSVEEKICRSIFSVFLSMPVTGNAGKQAQLNWAIEGKSRGLIVFSRIFSYCQRKALLSSFPFRIEDLCQLHWESQTAYPHGSRRGVHIQLSSWRRGLRWVLNINITQPHMCVEDSLVENDKHGSQSEKGKSKTQIYSLNKYYTKDYLQCMYTCAMKLHLLNASGFWNTESKFNWSNNINVHFHRWMDALSFFKALSLMRLN